ncbi:hypothetical protein J4E05_13230 [Thalassospira sp. NFXS8]|uniref:tetratricopeptide repeat protein n=1 Tax=Thalassospira sp. NFXS8 TaxID=2819093 RepID=UPI0032DE6F8C
MIWWSIAGLSFLSFVTVFFTAFWRGQQGDTPPLPAGQSHRAPTPEAIAKPKYQIGDVVDDDDEDDLDDDFDYIEYRSAQTRHSDGTVVSHTGTVAMGEASPPPFASSTSSPQTLTPAASNGGQNAQKIMISAVMAAIPVVAAFGIYMWQGHPDMPARPYAERASERNIAAAAAASADPDDPAAQTDKQIRRLLGQIVISLESNPRNLQGWLVLARGSLRLGDIERAVAAYRRAYALSGQNPLLAIEYADTRITAQGGQIDEISRNLVLHALGQMPNHRLSRYYYGIMLEQQGHLTQSLHVLRDLIHDLPADAPLSASTAAEIASLEAQLEASENAKNSAASNDN